MWKIPGPKMIDIIYKGTVAGSPARRCLIDIFAYGVKGEWITAYSMSDFPAEFLQELAISPMYKRSLPASVHSAKKDGGLEYLEQEKAD